ncbi:DUF58 domain-containing protein [Halocatena pleomorpha]|uniref:DUF58 domain-containing protein n=1 Tax=Halocatena pleomorpha TaxID=1785090 RepID=A0A3P3REF4_9EURY|nr:DUF58 domain-containing protein [Halocatena pleomorpha]
MNALALLVSGVGILATRPGLVLSGVVVIVFAVASRVDTPPTADLDVQRRVSADTPAPNASVTVTVTVTNAGNALCPELRVIDGVPPALTVESGSPRHGTALRPGKTVAFEYTVSARRGVHRFDPLVLIARNASGTTERRRTVESDGDETITCRPPLSRSEPVALPLYDHAAGVTGRVATSAGGAGTAFHSVREYRHGDPPNRIDWNHTARTGELTTVEYRQERSATVVLLVDARSAAYVAPDPDKRPAIERSIAAAGAVFDGLLSVGNRVGLAALSPTECWLAPASGTAHRVRARELLGTHPALAPTPPEQSFLKMTSLRRLRHRLPTDAQVVFCSPLPDSYAATVARQLHAHGHPTTVLSPDPTQFDDQMDRDESTTETKLRLAGIERSLRCSTLRDDGVRVVDWGTEPLREAVATASRRWSK